ncbi:MAG: arylsulfatase, partial [Planctomycetes bacterium]|nr:arylsulfatase [Planctomycetota bacterium]
MRRRFMIRIVWLAALSLMGLLLGTANAAERANVIVVITDDQGYGDLSCHGNPVVRTPNLDQLYSESLRHTDFHAAPMCTPTRGQLMTGLDAFRNGAMNVSSGRTLLRRGLPTMADVFAASGYRTGIFGKWHLGDNYPFRPHDCGFHEALWFPSSHINSVPDYWNNDYFDDTYLHNGRRRKYDGYCTDIFFAEAIDWMKRQADQGQSFFTYLPLNAPHGPLFVPERYRRPVRERLSAAEAKLPDLNPGQRASLVSFLAMIENIDENVGRLESFLADHGLRENTLLIFLTDNGSTFGPRYYNAGMKGGKTTLWEGGHRVPLFVRWPGGGFAPPRDVGELTQVQDLLPTLIDVCGLAPPADATFDGVSL